LGNFQNATGDFPYLKLTALKNGIPVNDDGIVWEIPLCDLDILQEMQTPRTPNYELHRSCRPGIEVGEASISTPTMILYEQPGEFSYSG
jgi:hypothetical protein